MILKYLYKIMYDHIKDAEMILGYAEDMKECGNNELMKYFGTTAKERATAHYTKTCEMFNQYMENEDQKKDECLYAVVQTMKDDLDSWRDDILKRIEKL